MKKYHKIQTVFLRDPVTKYRTLLRGHWSKPEFEYLRKAVWYLEEKVDGTNIRVLWQDGSLEFRGKTDRATIPPNLMQSLVVLFNSTTMTSVFDNDAVCLYGEGYGAKIQKGGGNYRKDNSFVLFDVLVGNTWLSRETVEQIAVSLGIEIVPVVRFGTLHDMIGLCENGFKSAWGDFQAEGIVAKPTVRLLDHKGDRIITKLKCKDFRSQEKA
jgi:hypothetical protein